MLLVELTEATAPALGPPALLVGLLRLARLARAVYSRLSGSLNLKTMGGAPGSVGEWKAALAKYVK